MCNQQTNHPFPPKLHQAAIRTLSHEGRGIAQLNLETVFIENALPGETVNFQYLQKNRKNSTGIALTISAPSALRVDPICKHFLTCGGCSLQHLAPLQQLNLKEQALLSQLKHVGNCALNEIASTITGPTTHYRRRARLSVKYLEKQESLLVGFHEKNGRYVNTTTHCKILHLAISEKIIALSQLINSLTIRKQLPQLEVACGDQTAAIVLRNLLPLTSADLSKIASFANQHQLKIYQQPHGPDTVQFIAGPIAPLSYQLPDHQLTIEFEPTDFIQVNAEVNQKLVNLVCTLLNPQKNNRILDLFCGIGNFTLPLAKKVNHIVGVEGSTAAVARAQHNACQNNLANVEFYSADLTKENSAATWKQQSYDQIILDPPRTGAKELCSQIQNFGAQEIIYISCNPATLARDTQLLQQQGYLPVAIHVADMYPHTKHLEAVIKFTRC